MADFVFDPPTGLLDTTVYKSKPDNETAARQQFMDPLYQLRDHINNEIGILSKRVETVLSVKEYGAVGDGITDDTAAIKATILAALNLTYRGINSEVFFPAGVYLIDSDKLFSDITYVGTIQRGISFKGVNPYSSVLLLKTSGVSRWFYDNGTGNSKFERLTFENLGFTTDSTTYGNGFKIWSDGGEKQFHFLNCGFGETVNDSFSGTGGIKTAFEFDGTANADLMKFVTCFFTVEESLFYMNNSQSVVIETYGCDFLSYGHIVDFGSNGGGSLHFFGGAMEMYARSGDTTLRYVVNIPSTASQGLANCEFNFTSVRYELKTIYKGLVCALGTTTGHAMINFDGCNIGTADGGTRDAVIIDPRKRVHFTKCALHENLLYRIKGTFAASASPEAGGYLVLESCRVGLSSATPLFSRITIEGDIGRAISRNCTANGAKALAQADAQDFDIGWTNAMPRESSPVRKIMPMKPEFTAFPYSGATEFTVKLPPGCLLVGVYAKKPTLGTTATGTYQLFIGSDDKTVTYGSSTSAQQLADHTIDVTGLRVRITASNNVIRLWANPAGTPTTHPGIAYVEYI